MSIHNVQLNGENEGITMSKEESALNGSVDKLANAFRDVVVEAVGEAIQPINERLDKVDSRLNKLEKSTSAMSKKLTTYKNQQDKLIQERFEA